MDWRLQHHNIDRSQEERIQEIREFSETLLRSIESNCHEDAPYTFWSVHYLQMAVMCANKAIAVEKDIIGE